jgi:hypothetical protein
MALETEPPRKSEGKMKNGAQGTRDIEGKVTRVGATKPGGERVSIKKELESMKQSLPLDLFLASWFPD